METKYPHTERFSSLRGMRLVEVPRLGPIANDPQCSPMLMTSPYKLRQGGTHLQTVHQGHHGGPGRRRTRVLVLKQGQCHQH
jgi:hypothetical protein